jgi:hypothetical protein
VFSEDKAVGSASGNTEVPAAAISFSYDATLPAVAVVTPAAAPQRQRLGNPAALAGTSGASAPNTVRKVELRILQEAGSVFANPAAGLAFNQVNGDLAWFNATYVVDWTSWSASSAVPFVNGSTYTIVARSQNQAGTYSVPYSSRVIVADNLAPQSGVSIPANGSVINSLPAITGTTGDLPGANPGVVAQMSARLKRLSDGKYWDGFSAGNWSASLVPLGPGQGVTVYTSSWNISSINIPPVGPLDLISGVSYYLTVSGLDDAGGGGNAEAWNSAQSSTFTFDNAPPLAGIASPLDGTFRNSVPSLSGSSSDDVSVSTVQLSLQNASIAAPNCYNPAFNVFNAPCPSWFGAQGTTANWTFAFPTQPWLQASQYVLRSSATDVASNVQTALSSAAFTFDVNAPTAVLTSPAYLNASATQITGTSTDAPAGLFSLSVAFSSNAGAGGWWNGASFSAANPVFLATTTYTIGLPDTWTRNIPTLTNGQAYVVVSSATDRAGNTRGQNLGSFTFDSQEPVAGVQLPAEGGFYAALPVISGTSADNVLVSTIALSIRDLSSPAPNCYDRVAVAFSAACPAWFAPSGAPGAWTLSGVPWVDGRRYIVAARATDSALNAQSSYSVGVSSNQFVFAQSNPLVGVSAPSTARERAVTTISGTASVPAPDELRKVEVRLLRLTGLQRYWDPVALTFTFDPGVSDPELAWATATYVTDWTNWTLSSAVPWVSGDQYQIIPRALDKAGNYTVTYPTFTFVYDNTAPQTGVSVPANNGIIASLPAITGTTADQTFNGLNLGTVPSVRLRLKRLSDNQCWDGASWLACPQTMTTTSGVQVWTSSWSVAPGNLPTPLASGASYYLTNSGTDNAAGGGNTELFDNPRGSTFTFDNTPPVASISSPINGTFRNFVPSFSGTGFDAIGISTVQLSLQNASIAPPNCYNPATNVFNAACPAWFGAQGTTSNWTFAFPAQPWLQASQYVLRSSATDVAANVQTSLSSAAFTFDVNAPTAALTVAAYLNAAAASIPGTSTDAPAGIFSLGVAVSSNNNIAGSWLTGAGGTYSGAAPVYLTTSSYVLGGPDLWTLSTPVMSLSNGTTYWIRTQATDYAGNVRTQDVGSFIYDTTSPLLALTAPNQPFYNVPLSITGTASDAVPGALGSVLIRISTATQDWTGTA